VSQYQTKSTENIPHETNIQFQSSEMSSRSGQDHQGRETEIELESRTQSAEQPIICRTTDWGLPVEAAVVQLSLKPHPAAQSPPLQTSGASKELTQDEIDKKPWKYIGYKGYSDFIASENDFFILRRFASVGSRIALELQDEVVVLEERLEDLDRELSKREMVDVNNGSFRDNIPERKDLLRELKEKIMRYSKLVLNPPWL
jgi:hypothetical protein